MNVEFYWLAVVITTIVSASRLTRLATVDRFPPVRWMRDKYADATDAHAWSREWQLLMFCGYCFSFWATALVIGTGLWAGVYTSDPTAEVWTQVWWVANGVLAGSYLAAILMANDGDDGDDD